MPKTNPPARIDMSELQAAVYAASALIELQTHLLMAQAKDTEGLHTVSPQFAGGLHDLGQMVTDRLAKACFGTSDPGM